MLATVTARTTSGLEVQTDFELIRCTCGAVIAELIVPAPADGGGHRRPNDHRSGLAPRRPLLRRGSRLRLKCDMCRDTILKHHPDFLDVSPGRLLVMQTIDLAEGEVDPGQVGIFKDHARGDRSATRGGEGLPRRVLDEALALARSGDTADGC